MQKQAQVELLTGDIVHLNSGSPDLKVVALTDEHVEVEWRDLNTDGTERTMFPRVCVCCPPSLK